MIVTIFGLQVTIKGLVVIKIECLKNIIKRLALSLFFWYYIKDSRQSQAVKWEVADTPEDVV